MGSSSPAPPKAKSYGVRLLLDASRARAEVVTSASAAPIRRSIDSTPDTVEVWMSTSAVVTASTGSAIITRTSTLRPRCRSASRRAIRSGSRHAPRGEAHRVAPASQHRLDLVGAGLVDDDAVAQEHDPVRPGRVPGLVGDQDAGGARVAAGAEQPQDLLTRLGVERSRRLVGEDQPPLADDRPRDRDPLLLAARHVVREPVGELGDADLAERDAGQLAGLPAAGAVELERQGDVLHGRQRRDQVEVLEDVADRRTPHPGPALLAERRPGRSPRRRRCPTSGRRGRPPG